MARELLRLRHYLVDGPDADLAPIQLYDHVATLFQSHGLPELGRYAQSSRLGDLGANCCHGVISIFAMNGNIWLEAAIGKNGVGYPAFFKAWSRSAMRSSTVSMPIETRTTSGPAPAAFFCSSLSWRCVVEAG